MSALCAGNRVVIGETNDVANSNSGIAGGEIDDWPLRIGKPRAVNQVRKNGEGTTQEAYYAPTAHLEEA